MIIHEDYIDYETNIYKCHATWTLYNEDTKWHRGELIQDEYCGFYSYQFNTMYKYLKETRIKDIFTDEELVRFWKKQIYILIKKTSEFDSEEHLKNCVEIELVNYYCSLKKWNDIQPL